MLKAVTYSKKEKRKEKEKKKEKKEKKRKRADENYPCRVEGGHFFFFV